ncbi:MAG: ABC-F family ATP-binding cassette domain-containing protein [Candidatus Omnitrophica bacterium]|nr:ABC-F family ATP-binding cassette domain-containing protein [Candidatus Omnitrophota bacterium]
MISAQQLTKNYGQTELFKDATFTVHKGERVGLVGRNGSGKTTLFRLIMGEESADEGAVVVPRGYRIGQISQQLDFREETVLEEACLGLPETERDEVWRAEKILTGLGFSESDFERRIDTFSGGYQMRLVLAKVLAFSPDLLLLDEPTNFLDIVSIRWLEAFLSSWSGEILVISHDRTFMDNVITHVMGIHRGSLKKIRGRTKNYYEQVAIEEVVHERQRVNLEKKRKQTERFIERFRAKARHASLAQSRKKALHKMEKKEKLASIQTLSFSFPCAEIPAKTIIQTDGLGFSYNHERPFLIEGLEFSVDKGDKVCVIGKNGQGKTTLIKLLAGDLREVCGSVKRHPRCVIACYEQAHTADLNPERTIEEELLSVADIGVAQRVRTVAGGMMFSGDLIHKRISVLSGGEKCRVMLGKLLIASHNLLLLDEPTQHLDIESCDAIIDAVQQFEGAAIIVTHDERFLYNVATKLIVFQHDHVRVFPGTYEEFLEQVGWDDEAAEINVKKKKRSAPQKSEAREDKQKRAAFIAEKSKALQASAKKVKCIEDEINRLEGEMDQCNSDMADAVAKQKSDSIQTLSKRIHALKKQLEGVYEKWTRVHDDIGYGTK